MSDSKTATERLREMLDARGVRYEKSEDDTTVYYDEGKRYTYSANPESGWAQLFGYHLTPEQAIAATLGSEYDRKLLAEAEREIVILRDKLRIANETGAKTCVKCGTFLSDELLCTSCAATLGSGECEFKLNIDMTAICCDKCGYELPAGTNLDTM